MKIHCSAPFTFNPARANAAEALAAAVTLKSEPFCSLVIPQYVCISPGPQRGPHSEPAWFLRKEAEVCGFCPSARVTAVTLGAWMGRGATEHPAVGLGHPTPAVSCRAAQIWLSLAGLTLQLFTQNVKAQAALEA